MVSAWIIKLVSRFANSLTFLSCVIWKRTTLSYGHIKVIISVLFSMMLRLFIMPLICLIIPASSAPVEIRTNIDQNGLVSYDCSLMSSLLFSILLPSINSDYSIGTAPFLFNYTLPRQSSNSPWVAIEATQFRHKGSRRYVLYMKRRPRPALA